MWVFVCAIGLRQHALPRFSLRFSGGASSPSSRDSKDEDLSDFLEPQRRHAEARPPSDLHSLRLTWKLPGPRNGRLGSIYRIGQLGELPAVSLRECSSPDRKKHLSTECPLSNSARKAHQTPSGPAAGRFKAPGTAEAWPERGGTKGFKPKSATCQAPKAQTTLLEASRKLPMEPSQGPGSLHVSLRESIS